MKSEPKLNSLFFDNLISIEMDGVLQQSQTAPNPLKMWNDTVLQTTQLTMEGDIRPAYAMMLNFANEQIFGGKLSKDPGLFLAVERDNNQPNQRQVSDWTIKINLLLN